MALSLPKPRHWDKAINRTETLWRRITPAMLTSALKEQSGLKLFTNGERLPLQTVATPLFPWLRNTNIVAQIINISYNQCSKLSQIEQR